MLGPFLNFFGHWYITLPDDIRVVFPLPFLILHYLPGFSTIRAPIRFLPVFVFMAIPVTLTAIEFLMNRFNQPKRIWLSGALLIIVLLDQFYLIPPLPMTTLPIKIYARIRTDAMEGTVLEIPFTIRDGMQYAGYVHAIPLMSTILKHQKPTIGGYLSRIDPSVFQYYRDLPFIGYLLRITDKGNYNLLRGQPLEPDIIPYSSDLSLSKKELDFLNINYVLLKQNEKYTNSVYQLLIRLGFIEDISDNNYVLLTRKPVNLSFTNIRFGDGKDFWYLGKGFSIPEDGFRWTTGKRAKIFFRINAPESKYSKLSFTLASYFKPQDVDVYINQQKLGHITVDTQTREYLISTNNALINGMNTVDVFFSRSLRPSDVSSSKDNRPLAVKFYSMKLIE